MGKLVQLHHDIVVIITKRQPIVIERQHLEELIQNSIVKWSESLDKNDGLYKLYKHWNSYYKYLCGDSRFFKDDAKEYAQLELNLLTNILDEIRKDPFVLCSQFDKTNKSLKETLHSILYLSETHNKTIGYRYREKVDGYGNEEDREYIIFENRNFFQKLFKIKTIDSISEIFHLSEVKYISTDDGINFNVVLNEVNRKLKQNVRLNLSIRNSNLFLQNKWTSITVLILVLGYWAYLYNSMSMYNDNREWTDYLTRSCTKTMTGSLKSMFYGDLEFWIHEDVFMDQWAEEMRNMSRMECSSIDTSTPKGIQERLGCMAFYRDKWNWFANCRPIVKQSCHLAGGRC